jgi:ketosteroid isomerase-like protein
MPEGLEQEITAHEEQLTRASQMIDIDALNRLYADDIMMTSVLGETGRGKTMLMDEARRGAAARQAAAAAGKPITGSYDKEELRVVPLGEVAVTSYRFVVKLQGDGIDVNRRYRATNVWTKRDGRWQVIAAHTAFVLDPKQAARLAGEPDQESTFPRRPAIGPDTESVRISTKNERTK